MRKKVPTFFIQTPRERRSGEKVPTFFIVGAPRSGTTAMYEYLKAHPQIFMAPYKEPHHFATDLKPSNKWAAKFRRKKEYFKLFSGVKNEKQVGTASVYYLLSRKAAKNIYDFNPDAKIIIMLRSPIEVMYSLYNLLYFGGGEDILSFEGALFAENDRKKGKKLPKNFPHLIREGYYYRETVKFSKQVKRYLDLFGKDKVKIIIFDDFKKNTAKEYRSVLEFLEVDPNFRPGFTKINPSMTFISGRLNSAVLPLGAFVANHFSFLFFPLREIYRKVIKFNLKEAKREPIDPTLEKKLKKEFLPEVKKLSKIISQNVTYWCR